MKISERVGCPRGAQSRGVVGDGKGFRQGRGPRVSGRRSAAASLVTALVAALAGTLSSCRQSQAPDSRPTASLAETTTSGLVFEHLRAVWARNDANDRAGLRRDLEAFVATFPNDGVTPLARVFLILSLMDAPADWARAERLLGTLSSPPPGSTRDLYIVARAKLLRYHHEPDAAFALLRPIVGKMVDGRSRSLLQEELTFDALEAREPYEAIAYMDAWLRGANEEDREVSEAKVAIALGAVPVPALRVSLENMRASAKRGESHGYGLAIERLVAERLGRVAVETSDATLARWLLDPDAGATALTEELTASLGQLATSKRGIGSVVGRTVGLVLPTSSPELRDESVDVLRGVLWALDLARDPREERFATKPHVDPVRLVTRDDGGDSARLRESLEEVAGEGATVILTALDADAARQALAWGASSTIPVIALARPTHDRGALASGFTVGEDLDAELALLRSAFEGGPSSGHVVTPVAVLADREATTSLAALGAATAGGAPLAPVPCDAALETAGGSRFPFAMWSKEGVTRWIVAGSTACAEDLFHGLPPSITRGAIGLGLEAAETEGRPRAGVRLVSMGSGVVPLSTVAATDPRAKDVRAMMARIGGGPRWWTAVGRDAATLARAAVSSIPTDTTEVTEEIARRRATVRHALFAARTSLWSTDRAGFDETGTLERELRVVQLGR